MKTSLKKITLFGESLQSFLQRIITQNIEQCSTPKLSAICNAKGRVSHLFWIQFENELATIWIDQSDAPTLLRTIQHYDPFRSIRFDLSNGHIWSTQQFNFSSDPILESHNWKLFLIEQGIPTLNPSLADQWTPHMLNLDQLGALCLNKGCFIGHEIIARVHFKGTTKKRMVYKSCSTPPENAINSIMASGVYHYLSIEPTP